MTFDVVRTATGKPVKKGLETGHATAKWISRHQPQAQRGDLTVVGGTVQEDAVTYTLRHLAACARCRQAVDSREETPCQS